MSKLIFYIILLITCLALLFSCYSVKKSGKQLDKAYDRYPALVAEKTGAWFPVKKIDSTIQIVIPFDSSKIYQSKIDSLTAIKQRIKDSIAIRYRDSCRTVTDKFDEGFNLGYEVGYYEGKLKSCRDTLIITKTYTIEDSSKIFLAQSKVIEAEKRIAKLEKKNDRLSSWLIAAGVVILLMGLVIYLIIRKIIKSAVNITAIK